MEKKLIYTLSLILSISISMLLSSCSSDSISDNIALEELDSTHSNIENDFESTAYNSVSAGEMHNIYLDQMYDFLKEQNGLSPLNIHQYSEDFFNTLEYSNSFNENYQYVINNENVDYELTENLNLEIQALQIILDNSDFEDFNEFQIFISEYEVNHINDENELIVFDNYIDVLYHSVIYWTANLDNWEGLLVDSSENIVYGAKDKCKKGNWWKRTWCNVKYYASIDAGGTASHIVINLIKVGGSVVFGNFVGAGVGASAGAVIKDLIF